MNPQDYIKKPCHENWNAMTGNDQEKFCDQCSCSVHNLTGMNHQQIMTLRHELGGKLCGAFHKESQPEISDLPKKNVRIVHLKRSLVMGASISTLALAACQSDKATMGGNEGTQPVENTTKPNKPKDPIKPEVLLGQVSPVEIKPEIHMGLVCPEKINPPKQEPEKEPIVMGKIHVPENPKKH